jgi:hypothetical protein
MKRTKYGTVVGRWASVVCLFWGLLVVEPAAGQGAGCGFLGWLPDTARMEVTYHCGGVAYTDSLDVIYCYPDPVGPAMPRTQYMIRQILGFPDSCVVTPQDMRDLGRKFITVNPQHYPCTAVCNSWCDQHPDTCCPSLYPEWRSSWSSCFRTQKVVNGTDTMYVATACEVQGICSDAYHVCCQNGVPVPHLIGAISTQECFGSSGLPVYGCYPVCMPPSGPLFMPCDTSMHTIIPPSHDPSGDTIEPERDPSLSRVDSSPDLTLHKRENE